MRIIGLFVLCLSAVSTVSAETIYAPADASREERFANPPACARILPIRHQWPNDPAQIDARLKTLKANGFGGFVGNVNMTSNYLHDAADWAGFRHLVNRAHEMGMSLWLYDEKGYPSCSAGGQTLAGHPEWQARAYLVSVTNAPDGSVRVTDIKDDYICEGTHISISLSYKTTYPNLLMREPTERFIEVTHDAYARELGPALRYIDSTFTDEPSLMTVWMKPMPYLGLPISDELLAGYKAKFGHPLKDDVPALVTGEPVGKTAEIRHRYWSMVAERVARNYTGRLTEWTTAHGILSGGHLLGEEWVTAHVSLYGDFFRVLRGLSAPSCDMLWSIPDKVGPETPLLAGSAGELNGSSRVMSEVSAHRQTYRKPGDTRPVVIVTPRQIVGSLNRQIWGGVNTFTSYYRWNDYTADEARAINQEIGRTITLASEGRSAAEVALLYPSDALMTGCQPQKHGGTGGLGERISMSFLRAVFSLFRKGRSFLVVDADSLAAAEVKDGALVSGPFRWRTVVLPTAVTLPIAAARKLTALQKAGGQVIALGERPVNSEKAFPDAEIAALAANWAFVPEKKVGALTEKIAERHAPEIAVVKGRPDVLVFSHRRTEKDGDVFFAANDSDKPWQGTVRLRGDPKTRIWDPRTGQSKTTQGEVELDLPPYGAVVLTTKTPVLGLMR